MALKAAQAILYSSGVVLGLSVAIAAEQIRFDTAEQWREWPLPMGVVQLDETGIVRSVEIRKNVCPNEINSCFGDVLLNPIALQKGVLCFATTFQPVVDANGPIFFVVTAGGHSFIKGNALLLLSMIHFAT